MPRWMVVGLVMCGSAALAECPGHVSTLPGVKLSRAEPFFGTVYRHTPEGLTEARVMERNGVAEEVSTVYAHPLAPVQRVTDKGTLTLDYGDGTSKLDRLGTSGSWVTEVVLKVDGKAVLAGQAAKRFLGSETIDIGDCRTKVLLVEDRMNLGLEDETYMILFYSPALGLVVRSVTMSADGQPLQGVEFDRIEALAG